MKKTALYAGSFDPITYGHIDLIEKAQKIFNKIIVLVSSSEKKPPLFSLKERLNLVRESVKHFQSVEVDSSEILTAEYAREKDICILLRGLRTASDLDYELRLNWMNQQINKSLETVFVTPCPKNFLISSQIIKEIAKIKPKELENFVPPLVAQKLKERLSL